MAKLRNILKDPNFLFLWLGQIISQFGDKFAMMALVGLVSKRAPGSTYEMAKLFMFVIIPVFLIGPVAGVYSDRWSRKWTMILSDAIRGILVLSIVVYWAIVPSLKPVFPVYIIVFLIFAVTRFFIPAKMAIVPELLTEEKILEGNSLMHITGMIASALGFGLGGIMVSLPSIGVRGGLIIDALTFFLSAVLLMFIRNKENIKVAKESIYEMGRNVKNIIKQSVFDEIKYGIRHIINQRKMHFVIALLFILASGVGASQVVLIVFIQNSLASITKDLGLLIMFFGVGLFAGAVAYGKFGKNLSRVRAILLSLLLGGIFLLQFLVFVHTFANFALAAAIAFFFGAAISPIIISSNTIVHELIPEDAHGKVFSSLEAVMHLAYLIFMFISAILAEIIGSFNILLIVGVIFVLVGMLGIRRSRIA
jgi:MFS transporter, DHA3 family, macrolide efflux protein